MSTNLDKPTLLKIGDVFPSFELLDIDGNVVTKDDLSGGRAVMFFYPKDNTAGCTREAKEFSAALPRFESNGIKLFGVSKDSVTSHRNFIEKQGLTVDLLSDPNHVLMEAVGAWAPRISYGRVSVGAIRSTFVISESGLVENMWKNVRVPGHVDNVLAYLRI